MTDETNEIICLCGHADGLHASYGCVKPSCDCSSDRESVIMSGLSRITSEQAARLSALEAGREADGERIKTLVMWIEELARCTNEGIKFVYHHNGPKKEAMSDMATATWRTSVKTALLAATAQKGERHD